MTILAVSAALAVGFFFGIALNWATIRHLRRRVRELRAVIKGEAPPGKPETMKRVIWICLVMGFAWVWCSYILAYLDHPQIAESLSQVAVTEIIGVVLAYAIKSSIENLSKHNAWPDKGETTAQDPPDGEGGIG